MCKSPCGVCNKKTDEHCIQCQEHICFECWKKNKTCEIFLCLACASDTELVDMLIEKANKPMTIAGVEVGSKWPD